MNAEKLPKKLKVQGNVISDESGNFRGNAVQPGKGGFSIADQELATAIVTRYNAHDALKGALEEARTALDLLRQHHDDLSNSNPGYMRKLCLQDYGLWNEALMAMDKGFHTATKALALAAEGSGE